MLVESRKVISGHAACATGPRSHVRWLGEPPPRRSDRVSPGGESGSPGAPGPAADSPDRCPNAVDSPCAARNSDGSMPWCTTRDLGQSLPSTPRSEVPHDAFHAPPAEVRPEGLPCPALAGVRDGSPRAWESDRLARTHRWQARPLELAEADAQDARPTAGVLRARLTRLLTLDNDVPDHRTISRRTARLGKGASSERRTVKPAHLRIDRSGLAGHVGQIERPIASATADAADATGDVSQTLEHPRAHRSPKVLIPPRKGAQRARDAAGTRPRHRHIRARARVGKRKGYVASGSRRRRKGETTFHRYKALLGSARRARGLASQRVEVRWGCKILNTLPARGIPDGEMIG